MNGLPLLDNKSIFIILGTVSSLFAILINLASPTTVMLLMSCFVAFLVNIRQLKKQFGISAKTRETFQIISGEKKSLMMTNDVLVDAIVNLAKFKYIDHGTFDNIVMHLKDMYKIYGKLLLFETKNVKDENNKVASYIEKIASLRQQLIESLDSFRVKRGWVSQDEVFKKSEIAILKATRFLISVLKNKFPEYKEILSFPKPHNDMNNGTTSLFNQ